MTQPELLVSTPVQQDADAPRYSLLVARDSEEVVAAQRLRYEVFAGEMGATLHTSVPGHDVDEFDQHCDHLVVRDDRTGQIVGGYRMLPPERAAEAGRLYSDGEFDLSNLKDIRHTTVETGRSCVHPDHRTGAVINLMWAGIANYLDRISYRWLGGCASVSLEDGGAQAAAVWDLVSRKHMSPPPLRVKPLLPWTPPAVSKPGTMAQMPSLLRGYLRLGSWVCGEPAYDPAFGCADFYVLLGLDRIDPRYLPHFLGTK